MPSILLVDDEADIRAILGSFLAEQGFVVHTARDGRHALHVLEKMDAPDLILLDYKMPVMNGIQFLAAKRDDAKLRSVPVVVLSAWAREWTGAGLGVTEVVAKPVDLEQLLALVMRLCGARVSAPNRPVTS